MKRRILSLYLPQWPIDRYCRQAKLSKEARSINRLQVESFNTPFALWMNERQTQLLYAVNQSAAILGLNRGMTLAEARAIHPTLSLAPANPSADKHSLEKLARWLVRYSPLVALESNDSLVLDITGCEHLFGGEEAMLEDLQEKLTAAGIQSRLALSNNKASAWALSHYGSAPLIICPPGKHMCASLPVQALQIDPDTSLKLIRLGLKTVGSLLEQPRPALARRFRGQPSKSITALLTRLDYIEGKQTSPISPLVPLPDWQVRQAFMEPALLQETIVHAAEQLLNSLMRALQRAERGVRQICLTAFRVDGSAQEIWIGTNQPTRDSQHILRLLHENLDQLQAEFGFDLLIMAAMETEPLAPTQLDDIRHETEHSASQLFDRLATRLGAQAVSRLKHQERHLPERTQAFTPLGDQDLEWHRLPNSLAVRPIRLLPKPERIEVLAEIPEGAPKRFRWRRVSHQVTKAEGPERIACEWWLSPTEHTRDYYRIEVDGGARYWLFRYGLYPMPGLRQGETMQPDWFVHGLFA